MPDPTPTVVLALDGEETACILAALHALDQAIHRLDERADELTNLEAAVAVRLHDTLKVLGNRINEQAFD